MSDEKMTNDELDSILGDLDDAITRIETKKAADLAQEVTVVQEAPTEEPPASVPSAAYVNFEDMSASQKPSTLSLEASDDHPSLAHTMIIGDAPAQTRGDDDENGGSTRVIDLSGVADLDEETGDTDDTPAEQPPIKYAEVFGCLKSIIYVVAVLIIAFVVGFYAYIAAVDVTGIGRDSVPIDIVIDEGDTTEIIAQKLKDQGVIQEPLFFRLYCRLVGADATFHPGTHTVRAKDGYDGIVSIFQNTEARATVTLMIREGSTIDQIADLLEQNNVCTASDFYNTLATGNFEDYDFIAELTPEQRENRVYMLEGYLFPDTYEFLQECSAETAIRKMLDNFGVRVNAEMRRAMAESDTSINDILIIASIIEKEAGFAEDMSRVSRVIHNRLNSEYDKYNGYIGKMLQMDSTQTYINSVNSTMGMDALKQAYDTYVRAGLPAGAICNPGLDAIKAALNPSVETDYINCFYFASIVETGETRFFEKEADHIAWCKHHGIGIYG